MSRATLIWRERSAAVRLAEATAAVIERVRQRSQRQRAVTRHDAAEASLRAVKICQ